MCIRDSIGDGQGLYLHIVHVGNSLDHDSSNRVLLELRSASNTGLTSDVTVHASMLYDDGRRFPGEVDTLPISPGKRFGRYLGLRSDETGMAGVRIMAFLSTQPFTSRLSYPDADN